MKIQKGDEIIVTAGREKGKKGTVEKVFPQVFRLRVSGINLYKKATKKVAGGESGMVEFARPLNIASVALICPECGKQTRVGYEVDKQGTKMRICKKCKKGIGRGKK